ncbi:DUF488 domain-containing protein [Yaniella halotolerans]|uniref:DUF488 domain-containing protein n=1 Tax=Yaniella halotolerans TaxID=225453 RepID=UPI0003B49E7C|nr:DUF488 domain-containing protein [Yaniella halotolerans]
MRHTTIFTVGHSNRELTDFIALLAEQAIEHVVDVRKLPGSKRYPQFNEDTLAGALSEHQIEFTRNQGLTGRRKVSKAVAFETNAWWQNRSFHNYADHALTAEFQSALEELTSTASQERTAIMCSEAVWWRCHRRLIADYLVAADYRVEHIMGPDQLMTAELSAGAVPQSDGTVLYPSADD